MATKEDMKDSKNNAKELTSMMKDEATAVIPAVVTTVDPTQAISEKEITGGLRMLLCSNAKIFEEMVRSLGEQNARLHEQVAGLTQLSLAVQRKGGATLIPTSVEVFNQAEDMRRLTRINMQMFDGTIRVLAEQNTRMYDQISVLTSDLLALLQPTIVIGACSKQDGL
jgi:hypothetical protein